MSFFVESTEPDLKGSEKNNLIKRRLLHLVCFLVSFNQADFCEFYIWCYGNFVKDLNSIELVTGHWSLVSHATGPKHVVAFPVAWFLKTCLHDHLSS